VREWVERRSTTQPTLTRRCAPASPCQGEASSCCFVGNRRRFSVRFLNGANPSGRQCRGDPVGRPWGCGACGTAASRYVGPSRTMAAGRRTASPLHAVRRAPCVVARHVGGARLHRQIGAVREPPLQCPARSVTQTCRCAPTCTRRFQGTAPPCHRTSGNARGADDPAPYRRAM
jgi:hypothetical protein